MYAAIPGFPPSVAIRMFSVRFACVYRPSGTSAKYRNPYVLGATRWCIPQVACVHRWSGVGAAFLEYEFLNMSRAPALQPKSQIL